MANLDLRNQYDLLTDNQFGERVAMAMYQIAREVLTESTTITGHGMRANFARSILIQEVNTFIKYGGLLISDPDIVTLDETTQNNIPDELIINGIRAMWNVLSGVVVEEAGNES